MRPHRRMMAGRAILSRTVIQVEDALEDPEYAQDVARAGGFRSMLAVPMMREGNPIGAIVVNRGQPGSFPVNQIDLLKTFADQAVIAIENVRLFKELEARNRDLTRDPGAADRHRRDPARHRRARPPTSSRSSTPSRERREAVRRRRQRGLEIRRRPDPHGVACHGVAPRASRPYGSAVPMRADARDGVGARRSDPRRGPRARRPRRSRRTSRTARPERRATAALPRACRCSARVSVIGAIIRRAHDAGPLHRHPGRATEDVRRSGRDRHRERAAVHGARSAQPRPDRDAGAADRDGRDPARHLQLARPTSSRSSTPIARARARLCEREFCAASSGSRTASSTSWRIDGHAEASRPSGARCPRADRRRHRRRTRRARPATVRVTMPDVHADPSYSDGAAVARGRASAASLAVPMLRDGEAIGAIAVGRVAGPGPSPTGRSSCSRPSPTRR